MLTVNELLRAVTWIEGEAGYLPIDQLFRGLRLAGELLIVTLTPAVIDRHARRSTRIFQ
jgi:hypothetical protein